ncbi:MAG: protein kinase domain-containing protein [Blastocatellia bacterium]
METNTTTRQTNTGAIISLLAAVAGLICYFLPWIEGGLFGYTQAVSAMRILTETRGGNPPVQLWLPLLALVVALFAAGSAALKGPPASSANKSVPAILILAGLVSAGMLGYLYVDYQSEMNRQPSDPFGQLMQGLARGIVTVNILFGAYGAFFSGLAVLFGGVIEMMKPAATGQSDLALTDTQPNNATAAEITTPATTAPTSVVVPVIPTARPLPPPPASAPTLTDRPLDNVGTNSRQPTGNFAAAQANRSCDNCGQAIPAGVRFCTSCGTQILPSAPPPPSLNPAQPSPPARPGGDPFATNQAPPPAPKDNLIGRTLEGKYRLDAVIGAGGMGTVYRATRLMIGDAIAIKVLKPDQVAAPQALERFRREAQAAARLKHPNAVTIHDFGVAEDGPVYLAMELVEGRSLRAWLREQGPLVPTAAAEVMRQVCAALDEAHRQQIVHRDLKPDNIIINLTPEGLRVKVLDFGIAKLRDLAATATSLTQTGSVMGTPHYMSPEQCLGEELDHRSDIYSLGVVLYEMLTGIVPFNSPTPMAVVVQHVNQAPPSPRTINLSLPQAVENVVLHALQKPREARPQTAGELARRLAAAVSGAAVEQPSPPLHGAVPLASQPLFANPPAHGAPSYSTQTPAVHSDQIAASGMMPTQVMQRMSSGQVAAPAGPRYSSGASVVTPLFGAPAAPAADHKRRFQLAVAGGAVALLVILLAGYFIFFSAKRNILAELKKGNLVIPEGCCAYDLFLKHGKNNFSSGDLAEIEREAIPALERRADQILTRLKQDANESETEWVEASRLFSWLNDLRPQPAYESRRYFSQARLSFLKNDTQRAIADYRRAIELDSSWAMPFNGLARAFLKMKDRASAKEYYQRATAADPQWLYPWINLGVLNYELNDFYGAEQALRRALELDPQRASAHYFLALTLEKQGRVCEALPELQLALNNAYNNNSPGFNVDGARKKQEYLLARTVC